MPHSSKDQNPQSQDGSSEIISGYDSNNNLVYLKEFLSQEEYFLQTKDIKYVYLNGKIKLFTLIIILLLCMVL